MLRFSSSMKKKISETFKGGKTVKTGRVWKLSVKESNIRIYLLCVNLLTLFTTRSKLMSLLISGYSGRVIHTFCKLIFFAEPRSGGSRRKNSEDKRDVNEAWWKKREGKTVYSYSWWVVSRHYHRVCSPFFSAVRRRAGWRHSKESKIKRYAVPRRGSLADKRGLNKKHSFPCRERDFLCLKRAFFRFRRRDSRRRRNENNVRLLFARIAIFKFSPTWLRAPFKLANFTLIEQRSRAENELQFKTLIVTKCATLFTLVF